MKSLQLSLFILIASKASGQEATTMGPTDEDNLLPLSPEIVIGIISGLSTFSMLTFFVGICFGALFYHCCTRRRRREERHTYTPMAIRVVGGSEKERDMYEMCVPQENAPGEEEGAEGGDEGKRAAAMTNSLGNTGNSFCENVRERKVSDSSDNARELTTGNSQYRISEEDELEAGEQDTPAYDEVIHAHQQPHQQFEEENFYDDITLSGDRYGNVQTTPTAEPPLDKPALPPKKKFATLEKTSSPTIQNIRESVKSSAAPRPGKLRLKQARSFEVLTTTGSEPCKKPQVISKELRKQVHSSEVLSCTLPATRGFHQSFNQGTGEELYDDTTFLSGGTPGGRDTHREPADTLVYQNISMLSRSLDMLHRPSPTPTPHTAPQQLYEDVDGFRQNPSYPVGQTIRAPEENYDYVVNVGAKMSVIPRSSVGDY